MTSKCQNEEGGEVGASAASQHHATHASHEAPTGLRHSVGIVDAVAIPRELFDFLMGAGEIDGTSFGELNATMPGRFWWRSLLRAAELHQLAANDAAAKRADGSKSRLHRRIDAARSLANDLAEQGQARMAQVIRDLCGSALASANVNARLHHDLALARASASAGVTRTGRDSEAGSVGEADSTRSPNGGDAQ